MPLDADRLGIGAATLVGTVVMAMGFLRSQSDLLGLALRVGISFVITYVAVFLFVYYVLRVILTAIAEERRTRRAAHLTKEPGGSGEATGEKK